MLFNVRLGYLTFSCLPIPRMLLQFYVILLLGWPRYSHRKTSKTLYFTIRALSTRHARFCLLPPANVCKIVLSSPLELTGNLPVTSWDNPYVGQFTKGTFAFDVVSLSAAFMAKPGSSFLTSVEEVWLFMNASKCIALRSKLFNPSGSFWFRLSTIRRYNMAISGRTCFGFQFISLRGIILLQCSTLSALSFLPTWEPFGSFFPVRKQRTINA